MNSMKNNLLTLVVVSFICTTSSFAQQSLFTWDKENVVADDVFISFNRSLSYSWINERLHDAPLLHSIPVSCNNNQYDCIVQLYGTKGINNYSSFLFFEIINQRDDKLIYRRFGYFDLSTTHALSRIDGDTNYFRKVDLDDVSYALFFSSFDIEWDETVGEMIIVVVSKNVATLVFDGPAAVISPADFDSEEFSMDYITDGTDMINPETGLPDFSPDKLAGKTKYRLYKDGNVLRIVSWVDGDGPILN